MDVDGGNKIRALKMGIGCHTRFTMLTPTLLLARSAVPVVAIGTVLGCACGDGFLRVRAEELKAR
jgi:hypothetical protein